MLENVKLGKILAANPLFAGIADDALQTVARLSANRELAAHEILFQKNDAADALYAVRRGEVRIVTRTTEGRELTLNLLGPGDVFGEIALLDGGCRTADAIATEVTILSVIRRSDFLDLLARESTLALRVIDLMCARVRWMSERMEETNLLSPAARIGRRLVDLAEDYGDDVQVTQDELAVFANTTRETVNRQLQAWKRQGLIELGRGHCRILSRHGLERATSECGLSRR
ncbi:Crp/Fnr family transcriptional regulator [Methylobacterium brachythecii]|uniref:CRP-like cAMP-binding protein n=1 Tax=Methylobacterium brachythecii TaxID=1176177 RepID=A0A7W6F844_9HYPH|nr:Crp/Fnr family transcriptional regulator [Methylobacterium brachythecii]MBB3903786.1 CRP-like cAMP-binding protein [Methylobacterium brachythecii]GLS44842.1 transcriptional regulator [Methylobacterium brachythecii]